MTLHNTLKSIILFIILIYIAPLLFEGIKSHYAPLLEPRTLIGVLTIKNDINNCHHYTNQLTSFFKNPSIKGIIIKIDSTENYIGTSQTIFHEIQHLKKEYLKPVIAVIENACSSGSYLIASASDYIIAPESAIIGGIGSFTLSPHLKNLKEEKEFSATIDEDIHQHCIKQIATARKLSLATTAQWADGKIFTGQQGKALGLINATGSLSTALTILKEKTLIEGEIELVEQSEKKNFYELLISPLAMSKQ